MWTEAAREASALARRGMGGVQHMQQGVQHLSQAAHQSRVYEALHKDRFTGLVPPGSKRDFLVKQAAEWSKAGLEKSAIIAMGGGALGVGGMAVANYTKYGGDIARRLAPVIHAHLAARRARLGIV